MSEPVVALQNVSFSYDGTPILEDVSFTIATHDCASIVGPNAGGKTTLLKLILGLLKPQRGTVRVFGKAPQAVRTRVGYMPQRARFDPAFPVTALDVVLMGCLRGGIPLGRSSRADRTAAEGALDEVGLADRAGARFAALSGGQQQRVLIARALVSSPELLLLDEPTANLDSVVEGKFYDLLAHLNERMTVVIVSHDIGFVSRSVRRVFCVNRNVVEHPLEQFTQEGVSQLYGGEVHLVRHDLRKEDPCRS